MREWLAILAQSAGHAQLGGTTGRPKHPTNTKTTSVQVHITASRSIEMRTRMSVKIAVVISPGTKQQGIRTMGMMILPLAQPLVHVSHVVEGAQPVGEEEDRREADQGLNQCRATYVTSAIINPRCGPRYPPRRSPADPYCRRRWEKEPGEEEDIPRATVTNCTASLKSCYQREREEEDSQQKKVVTTSCGSSDTDK